MKFFALIFFIIASSFCLSPLSSYAQGDHIQSNAKSYEPYFYRKAVAQKNISELRNGTLIIRFVSFREKIEYLNKVGKTEKANQLQNEIESNIKSFMDEFHNDYNFSNYVFCFGVDLEKHLNGESEFIFLNDELEIDPSITINNGPIFILGSQANGRYFLYDTEFIRVPKPAPYAMNLEEARKKYDSFLNVFYLFGKRKRRLYSVKAFDAKLNRLYR